MERLPTLFMPLHSMIVVHMACGQAVTFQMAAVNDSNDAKLDFQKGSVCMSSSIA